MKVITVGVLRYSNYRTPPAQEHTHPHTTPDNTKIMARRKIQQHKITQHKTQDTTTQDNTTQDNANS